MSEPAHHVLTTLYHPFTTHLPPIYHCISSGHKSASNLGRPASGERSQWVTRRRSSPPHPLGPSGAGACLSTPQPPALQLSVDALLQNKQPTADWRRAGAVPVPAGRRDGGRGMMGRTGTEKGREQDDGTAARQGRDRDRWKWERDRYGTEKGRKTGRRRNGNGTERKLNGTARCQNEVKRDGEGMGWAAQKRAGQRMGTLWGRNDDIDMTRDGKRNATRRKKRGTTPHHTKPTGTARDRSTRERYGKLLYTCSQLTE